MANKWITQNIETGTIPGITTKAEARKILKKEIIKFFTQNWDIIVTNSHGRTRYTMHEVRTFAKLGHQIAPEIFTDLYKAYNTYIKLCGHNCQWLEGNWSLFSFNRLWNHLPEEMRYKEYLGEKRTGYYGKQMQPIYRHYVVKPGKVIKWI